MRVFKRVGIILALVLFLSIALTGFQVYLDLVKREEDMNSFVRLSVKDAIVNIQTTEESGLNVQNTYTRKKKEVSYQAYLNALAGQASDPDTLELIREFLVDNSSEKGDAMFRPIQFGMTYIDTELFKESFIKSLQQLIDMNYSHDSRAAAASQGDALFDTKVDNTLIIKSEGTFTGHNPLGSITIGSETYETHIQIEGPYLIEIDESTDVTQEEIFNSLYGGDLRKEYIDLKDSAGANLGISSQSMPNFFIYYDITVSVDWASVSTNPLLGEGFLGSVWGVPDQYFSQDNGYLMIPGKQIEYEYRYVLLN